MEALVALGLACNVIQIISFGRETISICRAFYSDASPDAGVVQNASRLAELSRRLRDLYDTAQTRKPLTKAQQELKDIATTLLDVSEQLGKMINKVTPKRKSKSSAISSAIKYQLQRRKIKELGKEIDQCQNSFQSYVLVHLCTTTEVSALQTTTGFASLDEQLQYFIRQYAKGNTKLECLIIREGEYTRDHISSQSAATRDHVTTSLQALQLNTTSDSQYQRLLASLRYDEMNARHSAVKEEHIHTFQWVFEGSPSASPAWDSLSEWLKFGDGVYWVSGKAGSGKSTLIKYIAHADETQEALKLLGCEPLIISFFIWNAGSAMQRSRKGLLCSLLHQIIEAQPQLCSTLLKKHGRILTKSNHMDWSTTELTDCLLEAIRLSSRPLCIFLDGLDEIDQADGQYNIVGLVEKLKTPKTKLCVASRPEPYFMLALENCPKLRLQELTLRDMWSYARDILQPLSAMIPTYSKLSTREEALSKLVTMILEKAEGVFLWVHLVVSNIRNGIINHDEWEELLIRVEKLPNDLLLLYNDMWVRLNEDRDIYRQDSALYFTTILDDSCPYLWSGSEFYPSLFDLMLASNASLQETFLEKRQSLPNETLVEMCETTYKRVTARCAGLLEFSKPLEFITSSRDPAEALHKCICDVDVRFIHRSAREFFLDTIDGKDILQHNRLSDEEHQVTIIQCFLCRVYLFQADDRQGAFYGLGYIDIIDPVETDHGHESHVEPVLRSLAYLGSRITLQVENKLLDLCKATCVFPSQSSMRMRAFMCLLAYYGCGSYMRQILVETYGHEGGMSDRFKNCLLLIASTRVMDSWPERDATSETMQSCNRFERRNLELISWLLDLGADHNWITPSPFYEHLVVTPFVQFLRTSIMFLGTKSPGCSTDTVRKFLSVITKFVDFDSNLSGRVLLTNHGFDPIFWSRRADRNWHPPLVVEANAAAVLYILLKAIASVYPTLQSECEELQKKTTVAKWEVVWARTVVKDTRDDAHYFSRWTADQVDAAVYHRTTMERSWDFFKDAPNTRMTSERQDQSPVSWFYLAEQVVPGVYLHDQGPEVSFNLIEIWMIMRGYWRPSVEHLYQRCESSASVFAGSSCYCAFCVVRRFLQNQNLLSRRTQYLFFRRPVLELEEGLGKSGGYDVDRIMKEKDEPLWRAIWDLLDRAERPSADGAKLDMFLELPVPSDESWATTSTQQPPQEEQRPEQPEDATEPNPGMESSTDGQHD